MYKTKTVNTTNQMAVDINKLQEMLGVGKNTADKIGKEAGAVIRIGRRKLFNVSKIQAYIDSKAEAAAGDIHIVKEE